MSSTNINININHDIDKCLLQFLTNITELGEKADFDISTVSKFIYSSLSKTNKSINYDVINRRLAAIKKYRVELKALLSLPLMKQRSVEWFEARKTRLTASDLYDAIKGGNGSIKLAKKKANIIIDNINYNSIPALKWGTMFEPMASRCYSQKMNNINIHDFGLLCDNDNEHFGASPDGINELGIMIEIKCPYSRKILDGVIPDKYKMQIQGQLAVCKLNECDYIECVFKSIEAEEEYLDIGDSIMNHGVIAEFYNSKGEYVYFYSEENKTPKECVEDIINQKNNCVNNSNGLKFSKYTYWKLDEIIIQRVNFDSNEWETIIPKINTFWNTVEEYKMLPIEIGIKKYCFIDDDDDDDNNDAEAAEAAVNNIVSVKTTKIAH
jgi:putative phage-type endonuclease